MSFDGKHVCYIGDFAPEAFDLKVKDAVAQAVRKAAVESGAAKV